MAHSYFSQGICSVSLLTADYGYAGICNINILAI